jgi:hypothetical protein
LQRWAVLNGQPATGVKSVRHAIARMQSTATGDLPLVLLVFGLDLSIRHKIPVKFLWRPDPAHLSPIDSYSSIISLGEFQSQM